MNMVRRTEMIIRIDKFIGKKVCKLRIDKDLSREELKKQIGLKYCAITKI